MVWLQSSALNQWLSAEVMEVHYVVAVNAAPDLTPEHALHF